MAHKWNAPVNRHVAHAVTCQLCGVFVERVFEGTRGVNYNTPLGGERTRGLAPKCSGAITSEVDVDPNQLSLLDLAADAAPEQTEAEDEETVDEKPSVNAIDPDAERGGDSVNSLVEDENEEPADENEADEDEPDAFAATCERYEAMTRKELERLASGKVKNYKKLSKDGLAFELAMQEQRVQNAA